MNQPISSEPLHTVSVAEAVAQALREMILLGRLRAGDTVTQDYVVGRFGKSRPSCMSSIAMLVSEGLLEQQANRPAYVPHIEAADMQEIMLIRRPLELEAVALLAGGTVPRLPMPRTGPRSISERIVAGVDFHRSLVNEVRSPRLSKLMRRLLNETHLCLLQYQLALGTMEQVAHHTAITTAIRHRDVPVAQQAMCELLTAEVALVVS